MQMTSAMANKAIKKLKMDLDFVRTSEAQNREYVVFNGVEPDRPDYDYKSSQEQKIALLKKIRKIRHAVNVSNATHTIEIGGEALSVDELLCQLAQYNELLEELYALRSIQPKGRQRSEGKFVQQSMANFDPKLAAEDYARLQDLIAEMQLKLDQYNQTVQFDVDIEL